MNDPNPPDEASALSAAALDSPPSPIGSFALPDQNRDSCNTNDTVTSVTSNIAITLPDGSVREFDRPVTGAEIAFSIGPRLAKDALAVKIDGQVLDLTTTVSGNAKIEIVTRNHPDAIEVIRHDAAHVLADAVQKLYPGTQVTIGPSIATGFYYDFARDEPFTPDDLEKIEAKMRELVAADIPIVREVWNRDDAIAYFKIWASIIRPN